ncbi:IPT/TIG domain-containing protein [Chloroflexota bacterium]
MGIALVLALLVATVPAAPVLAQTLDITQKQCKIGEKVDVWSGGLNLQARVVVYLSDEAANPGKLIDTDVLNYEEVVTSVNAITNPVGEVTFSFLVPSKLTSGAVQKTVRGGTYYVYLTYFPLKNIVAVDSFVVESTGGITLDPEEGVVGTEVEISGEGFDGREDITVEYDDDEVDIENGDDSTDSSGDFDCTILLPESAAGVHTITVIGGDSEIEASAEFTVEPKITIAPASGTTGDTITVNGTGFGDELEFSIFLGDDKVVADEETNRKGSFQVTFAVPSKAAGSYDIEAEDEDGNSYKVAFTVAASSISLSSTSGHAGNQVTVSGSGFQASKPITITFDNETVATPSTDASGKFSATFTVPVRATGSYQVKVSSDSGNPLTASYSIGISATITPTTSAAAPGYVGTEVTINGVGFVPNSTLTVTYAGTKVATAVVDTNGNFSATFDAPAGSAGQYAIIATDGTNSQQFPFVMESTPPPIPAPLKPEMGIKADAEAYFDWEDVADDSLPVTYTLQIATENFSADSIVLEKKLTESEYTITKEERLKSAGKDAPYYWRVRAVDGAGNEGDWSGTGSFSVGSTFSLSQATIYTLLGIGSLLLFAFGFWLGRKTAYF